MRWILVPALVLTTIACLAQQPQTAKPADPTSQTASILQDRPTRTYTIESLIDPAKAPVVRGGFEGPACYTMRAYVFSAGTPGQAPVRTGYTTCVSSQALQMRQTKPAPKAKLRPMQFRR